MSIWQNIEASARLLPRPSLAPLKPSFMQPSWHTAKVHPTAWLDGIRGYACFIVFIFHFQFMFHKAFLEGYSAAEDHKGWIQLPFVRLLVNGLPMVAIFFVLSGIALSLKPIQLARNQSWEPFFDTMFSSLFRRWLRLYLPVYFVQSCQLLLTCLGLYTFSSELSAHWPFIGTNDIRPRIKDNNWDQIHDWFNYMVELANPFHLEPFWMMYDGHLWTIPTEFRDSMILFAALVGTAKLRPRIRIGMTAMLYCFAEYQEGRDLGLFIAGMGLAELLQFRDENARANRLPLGSAPEKKLSRWAKAGWIAVFIFALHMLNWPPNSDSAYGYIAMDKVVRPFDGDPQNRMRRVGAILFMLTLCAYDGLRRPFQTGLARYLGKISFALYIVHGPLEHLFGTRLVMFFWRTFGNESFFTYELGVWVPFAITAIVVIWTADLVTRLVDAPSVRFGRWLQSRWSC